MSPAALPPLHGIRVADFSRVIAGPLCAMTLADLGADVVKIENPEGGDDTRGYREPDYKGLSPAFLCYNRNKRSIALDLKSEEGRALAHAMVEQADVVLENYGPGTMERLGCGWEDLRKLNPRLIYCALKGFLSGPYEHRPALDEVVQFMGGLAYMTGPPGRPLRAGTSVIDIMGGTFAVIAVLAALRERDRTGKGQLVKSALFESTVFLMAQHMAGEALTGREVPPMPARHGAWGIYEPFETEDGEQVFIGITSDNHWRRFCEEFGRGDLLADPAYATNEARVAARPQLLPIVTDIVKRHSKASIVEICERIGVPFAPVARTRDLFDDPQVNANGRVLEVEMPTGGTTRLPRLPMEIGDHDLGLRRQPPAVGADTVEILREFGVADDRIEDLRTRGIIIAA